MKQPRDDFVGEQREAAIIKARQTLGLKQRRNSSSRRQIVVPDRPADMHTPLVMSAANPLSNFSKMGVTPSARQKTTQFNNSDIPSDLLANLQESQGNGAGATAAAMYGAKAAQKASVQGKAKLPLASKRGNSLNPNRLTKTSCGVDFAEGTKPGDGTGRVETPEGTAGDSTAFSKRSNATGGRFDDAGVGLIRPNTEFLPSAS